MNQIKFAIPGLYNHFDLTKKVINFKENFPEAFLDNVNIGAVYGNFQYCIWDGGRNFASYNYSSLEVIRSTYEYLKEKNIPLRLIFTNTILEEKHLSDRFCNLVCSICEDENNEIVVNSPLLENYIKTYYPKYQLISSTTKCNILSESIKELDRYKYVCLDYNNNHNWEELDKLSQEKKDKIEFLCNAICPSGCPNRKEHYRLNSLYHLNFGKNYCIDCAITNNTLHPDHYNQKNTISSKEIQEIYVPKGFSMFKLEGRTLGRTEVALNIANYLLKPEWKDFFIMLCIE